MNFTQRKSVHATMTVHTLVPPESAWGKTNVILKRPALPEAIKTVTVPNTGSKGGRKGKGKQRPEDKQVPAEWAFAKHLLR